MLLALGHKVSRLTHLKLTLSLSSNFNPLNRGSKLASGLSLFVGDPPSTYSTIFTPSPPVESRGLKTAEKETLFIIQNRKHSSNPTVPQNSCRSGRIRVGCVGKDPSRGQYRVALGRPGGITPYLMVGGAVQLKRCQRAGGAPGGHLDIIAAALFPEFLRCRCGDLKQTNKHSNFQ